MALAPKPLGDLLAAQGSPELTLMDEQKILDLAEVAHRHALAHPDGGAGLCLPVAAALGYALREHHDTLATAVTGYFQGEAHWWLEVDGVRIDPTRHQFDDRHDLTYPVAGGDEYQAEATFPALWTRDQVVAEAERAFALPVAAYMWARALLNDLDAL